MAPTVVYRQLGKSGLRVSVPIIGAMSFGHKDWASWVIEEEQAIEVLKAAWDRGVTTIDTANMYSNGVSEEIIAKFMKKYNIPRHKLLILTKCFFVIGETPGTKTFGTNIGDTRDYVNQSGLSRAAIFNAVDASLKRLDTDYIDLLQIHRFDPKTPVEETMKALHDLVQSGKVRYIGASSMRTWQFAMMNDVAEKHNWTKFVSMQNEYSLIYREDEREMIPYCLHNGIGIIPWGPIAGGHLARPLGNDTTRSEASRGGPGERKHSDTDQQIIQRVGELAKKKDVTMAHIALAWTMNKVSSPIVGVSSVERLEAAMIGDFKLTEEETKYLEEPYQPHVVRGHA
ncbi:Aldo/keto reductase [Exidia glandulosa HHB12029]|uniref:Aldo/keto reductase n=1 Tax=Exidia glandulosa HHB12029 TaxID=1314781 RepID=A0A165M4U4_EXIGL|nr:Aldo/keto reductase [Exidia glandulosa HHB12029]